MVGRRGGLALLASVSTMVFLAGMLQQGARPVKRMAALGGRQAVQALKQQGAYNSLRRAVETALYQVEPVRDGAGHQAWNQAQGLRVEFAREAITLHHRLGSLKMQLAGYGRGDRLKKPALASVAAEGQRIEYRRGDLTEWYVNEARGLEQGFTIQQRPEPLYAEEPLVLALETSGDVQPEVQPGVRAVRFVAGGQAILRYSELVTFDAQGRPVPCHMEVNGRSVHLVVEDALAEYPLTVDPLFTQQAKLLASDGVLGDLLGTSVALSGDTALLGPPAVGLPAVMVQAPPTSSCVAGPPGPSRPSWWLPTGSPVTSSALR